MGFERVSCKVTGSDDIPSLSLILTVVVPVVVVVMAVLAACMIVQIPAHDFGGNTNVPGIVG